MFRFLEDEEGEKFETLKFETLILQGSKEVLTQGLIKKYSVNLKC